MSFGQKAVHREEGTMSRRAAGEGTIGRRKNGTYYGSIRLEGKYRWCYGKTRAEVVEKLRAIQKQYDQGVSLDAGKMTVSAFLARWLEDSVKQRNKPRTYASYRLIVNQHIIPAVGALQLASLRPDHVQKLINQLSKNGLAPRSVRNVRAVLRRALNQAIRWRYITYNAAALVDMPRIEPFKVQPLTREEARQLLAALKGHRLETLYLMALLLGLREGELLALLISNLDLEAGCVSVEATLQWQEGKLVRTSTKTRASIRKLPLPPSLIPLLKAHIERQQARFPQNTYLFASTVGTPINCYNLLKQFNGLLRKAGLRKLRFHDLRHSCATFLIARGEHPRTVMDILGHSQISTTMNTYGHILDETRTEAIAGLDGFLAEL
jgi:integrase